MSIKSTRPSDEVAAGEDLAAIGQLLLNEWLCEREQERQFIRRESEAQTALARRQWRELARMAAGELAEPASTPPNLPPATFLSPNKVTSKAREPRLPRRGLAKMVEREWATPEGQRFLVSASMRGLAIHFRIDSHSSLYDVPLFNEKIRPLREMARAAQSAGAWMERNARDRHR